MKKKKRLLGVLACACALALGVGMLAGCSSSSSDDSSSSDSSSSASSDSDKSTIKIGIRSDLIDLLQAIEPDLEAAGYTVEEVVFDDSVQPNVALEEGSIDINWYQHGPYLDSYNESNGTDLVMVEPKSYYPLFAMYSEKITSIDDLEDGATIGLCNDSSNRARGLKLLESYGLITLNPDVEAPTQYDITDNPKNLQFIEAEMSVLPQSIGDVDAICLAATHMVNAGKDADSYVVQSTDGEDYAVGFVVRGEDADADWATAIAEAAQCDDLATELKDGKKGTMLPAWE